MQYEPKKLTARFLEFAVSFALGAFLLRLGVAFLLEIWWMLVIVAVVATAAVIGFRMWRNRPKW